MKELLHDIGLTKGEIEIYLTLLETGNTSTGKIIKKSGVSRSKVYEVLERLKQKGFVTEMKKQNVKHFEAATPHRIVDYIENRKKELDKTEQRANKIIPELVKIQERNTEKQETRIYTGFQGWKTLYTEILNNLDSGDEYLAFGIGPEELEDKKIQLFFKQFHMKRDRKGIRARIIMSPKTKELMKKFSNLRFYEFKFLDTKFPTNINIHKNNVVTLVWDQNPVAFLIQSEQVANKYRIFFEEMWKLSKT